MAVSDSLTVTVNAPSDQVLAKLRDVGNQSTWFPGNLESEVLSTNDDGLVAQARLVNDVKVAKDEFVLDYTHSDDGFSWTLNAPSKAQKTQNGSWKCVAKGDKTDVTFSLEIDTTLPLPGFIQKKTLKDTLKNSTKALQGQF